MIELSYYDPQFIAWKYIHRPPCSAEFHFECHNFIIKLDSISCYGLSELFVKTWIPCRTPPISMLQFGNDFWTVQGKLFKFGLHDRTNALSNVL